MPTSTGTYDQNTPPGPVVTVTDTGGGDRERTVLVTLRWSPANVIVGPATPAAGSQIDLNIGWCEWNVKRPLGTAGFKLPMVSTGGSSIVRAEVLNVSMGSVWANRHRIDIPSEGRTRKEGGGRRKAKTRRKA